MQIPVSRRKSAVIANQMIRSFQFFVELIKKQKYNDALNKQTRKIVHTK